MKIKDAEILARGLDCQAVVIVAVARNGEVTVVSYGENRAKCKAIGEWAQGLWSYAVSVVPFQTVFGWGNGGQPKALSQDQLAQVKPSEMDYVMNNDPILREALQELHPGIDY